jgi:hypothetical protein
LGGFSRGHFLLEFWKLKINSKKYFLFLSMGSPHDLFDFEEDEFFQNLQVLD